jgi:hypothetical protein
MWRYVPPIVNLYRPLSRVIVKQTRKTSGLTASRSPPRNPSGDLNGKQIARNISKYRLNGIDKRGGPPRFLYSNSY